MATATQQLERLERLKYRKTLYELVIEKDGQRYLAGYTQRTRRGLLSMLRKNGETIAPLFGGVVKFEKRASDGAYLTTLGSGVNTGWHVHFSGRTEREAISEGELTFVGDLTAETAH